MTVREFVGMSEGITFFHVIDLAESADIIYDDLEPFFERKISNLKISVRDPEFMWVACTIYIK